DADLRAWSAGSGARPRDAVVHSAVTVVVDVVAGLGRGRTGLAGRRCAGDAGRHGEPTGAQAARAWRRAVVEHAVAVVAAAVAHLGARRATDAHAERAGRAGLQARTARIGARAGQTFVDHAVAVVVDVVAGLGAGRTGIAGLRCAGHAVLHRAPTRA